MRGILCTASYQRRSTEYFRKELSTEFCAEIYSGRRSTICYSNSLLRCPSIHRRSKGRRFREITISLRVSRRSEVISQAKLDDSSILSTLELSESWGAKGVVRSREIYVIQDVKHLETELKCSPSGL